MPDKGSKVLIKTQILERVLCVIDRTLRNQFSEDFHKRCMYAAFGMRELIRDLGYSPILVGGNFAALVVSRDQRQASMQGYSSQGCSSGHSHYWVEVEGSIIDLGTTYLPIDSSYPALAMPVTNWDLAHPFARALQYQPEARYDVQVELDSTVEVSARMDKFLKACRKRMAGQLVNPRLGTWLLRDPTSMSEAVKRKDPWATAALRFEGMSL